MAAPGAHRRRWNIRLNYPQKVKRERIDAGMIERQETIFLFISSVISYVWQSWRGALRGHARGHGSKKKREEANLPIPTDDISHALLLLLFPILFSLATKEGVITS